MASLYVSPTGSDSNAGTSAAPFATIAAAAAAAAPGTTIHVAPGTYAGGFTTSASGTASAPISYVSETPGAAVIVGNGPASTGMGWQNTGSNVNVSGFNIDGAGSNAASWRFGFYSTGSNVVFQANTVGNILNDPGAFATASASGMGGAGIEMDSYSGGSQGSVVGNTVYNIGPSGQSSSLVHGIYQTESGTVANNVIYDVVGNGVTSWHGANNINIVNNTVDNARDGGIFVGSGDGGSSSTSGDYFSVENNIITGSAWGIAEGGTTGVHNVYQNNLLYNNTANTISLHNGLTATGTVTGNPSFVASNAANYQLQSGSPAIGAGTLSGAPATDINGVSRSGRDDIGAYQYGGPPATAASTSTPASSSPPTPATVSADKLSLILSEDAFGGDAQFIVKMDGSQIGGPTSVTALHAAGATQEFDYTGNWGPGPHTVQIDFINDAYIPGQGDRNLHVDGVSYNGASFLPNDVTMWSSGAFDVAVRNGT